MKHECKQFTLEEIRDLADRSGANNASEQDSLDELNKIIREHGEKES